MIFLKDLLSLKHNHILIPNIGSETAMTKAMEHLSAPFDDLVLYHLKYKQIFFNNDYYIFFLMVK